MSIATLTKKGQITIPAAVREALRVSAGDRVQFVRVGAGRYEFIAATSPVTALRGMFGKSTRRVTIDAMRVAIAKRGASTR